MKAKSVNSKLEEKFGATGSASREAFRDEAFSFYFGEIIRSRKKELSQEELA